MHLDNVTSPKSRPGRAEKDIEVIQLNPYWAAASHVGNRTTLWMRVGQAATHDDGIAFPSGTPGLANYLTAM